MHGAEELLQLEWPVFRKCDSVQEVEALERLLVLRCIASLCISLLALRQQCLERARLHVLKGCLNERNIELNNRN